MAMTGSGQTEAPVIPPVTDEARHERLGWVRRDPIRAVAVALILIQLVWRADIATRGWFSQDEFYIASHAAESQLNADYLFGLFNNHFMPAGLLIAWLVTKAAGHTFWPYGVMLTIGQAVLSVAFYRLLRTMFRPSWALLIPLCLFLYSPLMLETTSLWVVGLLMLPVLLTMVLAIGAQVKYIRTRRRRHLVTLAASVVLGLAFSEKSLLVVPLVFMVTVCLFVKGGPFRSIWRAAVRFWQSWLVLGAVALIYMSFYARLSATAVVPKPKSVNEVLVFLGDLIGTTMIPGLFGGPWQWWYAGDGPPLVDPPDIAMWITWAAFAALIVVTTLRRPGAGRAWVLLGLYFAMVAGLLAATRMGNVLSPLAGWVARYVSDAVLVAAIAIGVALVGLKDASRETRRPLPAVLRSQSAVAIGLVVTVASLLAISAGAILSTTRFRDNWDTKHGMDYLRHSQEELAKAPAGTVFLDEAVPNSVIEGYWYPYNQQSRFFLPARYKPVFVTEAENPSVFDHTGRIRPATVTGVSVPLGPVKDCGHFVGHGKPTRIPLEHPVFDWPWVVRIGYLSSGDSTATLRLGRATHQFKVRKGLNQIFFQMQAEGDAVEVTVTDPAVSLCTNLITVGKAVPKLP